MAILYIIFWFSFGLMGYSYILYPLLLKILALSKKPNHVVYISDELPAISILIAAHNEEAVIAHKLESIYYSNYPMEKIEIYVGSDASTDRTDEIVNGLMKQHSNLHLVSFTERKGKIHIINRLVEQASSSIIIITDANVFFERDTLAEMGKHFANPDIALVDTQMRHKGHKMTGIAHGESYYIKNEVNTKFLEGVIWGTMIGPFGGCYAVRKDYFSPVPENFLVDDFYINMKVLERGGKAISEPKAIVIEDVSNNIKDEFQRKIRIATGSFQNLFVFYRLLFRGATGLCFFSHKVIRWFGPVFILALFITDFRLAYIHPFYAGFFWIETLLILFIPADFILAQAGIHIRLLRLVRHFFFSNLAVFIGMFKAIGGVSSGIWQPTKRNQ